VERRRVAAIGIDAAEWRAVKDLVAAGRLPRIGALLAESSVSELEGEPAYRAEAVWTELIAGRPPSSSDYWSIADFDPLTYDVRCVGAFRGAPFWAHPELRTIAFDVPQTHLSPDVRGIQVTGWGAHSPQFPTASWPGHVIAEIDRRFGVHRAVLSDSFPGWHNEQYLANLSDALVDGLSTKVAVTGWLLEQLPDWDLFVTVLGETHTAGHQFLHGVLEHHPLHGMPVARRAEQHLHDVWAAVDDTVGRLVDLVGDDTTVVLFAVHGMRTNGADTANVLLPELVHRLRFGSPFLDLGPFDPDAPPLLLDTPEIPAFEYLLRRLTGPRGTMGDSRAGALRNRAAWLARRWLPGPAVERLEAAVRRRRLHADGPWWEMRARPPAGPTLEPSPQLTELCDFPVPAWWSADWPALPWFVIPSFSDVHLRVNLAGRERSGVVAASDYERTLDEIEHVLRDVTDARRGGPVIGEIHRMRTADPFARRGPSADLVVTVPVAVDAVHHPAVGVLGAVPFFRSGEHSAHGWCAVRTPDRRGGEGRPGRPCDVSATVLELLGRGGSPLVTGRSLLSVGAPR
jgi:predicted AlkP superfamily phosphohydrolase/phosphomutase